MTLKNFVIEMKKFEADVDFEALEKKLYDRRCNAKCNSCSTKCGCMK